MEEQNLPMHERTYNKLMEQMSASGLSRMCLVELQEGTTKMSELLEHLVTYFTDIAPLIHCDRRNEKQEIYLREIFGVAEEYFAHVGDLMAATSALRRFRKKTEDTFKNFIAVVQQQDSKQPPKKKRGYRGLIPNQGQEQPEAGVVDLNKMLDAVSSYEVDPASAPGAMPTDQNVEGEEGEVEDDDEPTSSMQASSRSSIEIKEELNDLDDEPGVSMTAEVNASDVPLNLSDLGCSGSEMTLRVMNKEKWRYDCKHCSFFSNHRAAVINHMKTHAEVPAPPPAEEPKRKHPCGRKRKFAVGTEIRPGGDHDFGVAGMSDIGFTVVGGEKRFRCDFCHYLSSKVAHMKAHVLRHIGTKSVCCEYCDYKSVCSTDMRRHVKRQHPEEPTPVPFQPPPDDTTALGLLLKF